jgi:hypothetical protein
MVEWVSPEHVTLLAGENPISAATNYDISELSEMSGTASSIKTPSRV